MIITEISHIFANLYAVQYEGESLNAFEKLQELWTDLDFIENEIVRPLEGHITSSGYFKNKSRNIPKSEFIVVLLKEIVKDTNSLFEKFSDAKALSLLDSTYNTGILFDKLGYSKDFGDDSFYKSIKVKKNGSYARVYAVRIEDGGSEMYFIVGGTIKVHDTMEDPYYDLSKNQLLDTKKYLEVQMKLNQ